MEEIVRRFKVIAVCVFVAAVVSPAIAYSDVIVPQRSLKPVVALVFFLILSFGLPQAYFANWSD